MKVKLKKVLFWTAVAVMPGGILVAAYRLGREHRKIVKIAKGLTKKKEEKNDD